MYFKAKQEKFFYKSLLKRKKILKLKLKLVHKVKKKFIKKKILLMEARIDPLTGGIVFASNDFSNS